MAPPEGKFQLIPLCRGGDSSEPGSATSPGTSLGHVLLGVPVTRSQGMPTRGWNAMDDPPCLDFMDMWRFHVTFLLLQPPPPELVPFPGIPFPHSPLPEHSQMPQSCPLSPLTVSLEIHSAAGASLGIPSLAHVSPLILHHHIPDFHLQAVVGPGDVDPGAGGLGTAPAAGDDIVPSPEGEVGLGIALHGALDDAQAPALALQE